MSESTLAIVGGGFAGTAVARRLERRLPRNWRIRLLSSENYITYNPLLAEVVGASILPGHVVAPVRQMLRRTEFGMVDVHDIDFDTHEIFTTQPCVMRFAYDQLVLACGVRARLELVPGMAEHALPLKLLGDALELRNRVLVRLERAELEPDATRRRHLTHFIVVGGGFSGIEVAGELLDFLTEAHRYYPKVRAADCRVSIIHGRDRLLNEISPTLGHYAERKMRAAGVDIHLNARAARVDALGVELQDGSRIEGATVICTIGTQPHELVQRLALPQRQGRILTDPDLSVRGYPEVWALGDCAHILNGHDQQAAPPTAQFAVREAHRLADNIARRVRSQPTRPFRYRPRGHLVSIGHNKAVAEIYGLRLSGFPAWLLWRGFYLLKIPTLLRKVRIFFEWNWEMLFPHDIVHLRFSRSQRPTAESTDNGARQAAQTDS